MSANLHQLLDRWRGARGADEYYELPLRSPYKEQVVSSVLNRFGGGMGAYTDSFVSDIPGVPYINATPFTFEDNQEFKYIGTMCPKINTFDHFWRMAWYKNTHVIVNLTHSNDRIGSERGDKREKYWPPYSNVPSADNLSQWPLLVETIASAVSDTIDGLYLYTIQLTDKASGEKRNVKLFWYSSWEDFGDSSAIYDASFRENALNVLMLANEVDIAQRAHNSGASTVSLVAPTAVPSPSLSATSATSATSANDSWLIVHCSAGVGK